MSEQEAQMVRAMQVGMESCVGKAALSGVMGFALGGAFGLFMSSVRPPRYTAKTLTLALLDNVRNQCSSLLFVDVL